MKRNCLTEDGYRRRFRIFKLGKSEGAEMLIVRINPLVEWSDIKQTCKDLSDSFDHLLREGQGCRMSSIRGSWKKYQHKAGGAIVRIRDVPGPRLHYKSAPRN
ncbi:hypothetical protein PoB_007515500 [Plakobranchus ocellatus]|uniref:Uncharacterized protein n=1 Tax=Plakobranchus ocellatus TaxID=259542 RepID=A0AAV4DXB0_9GAST|nr:hypothetical protein PoB_007515500 [Plakobranchus ocellatus]